MSSPAADEGDDFVSHFVSGGLKVHEQILKFQPSDNSNLASIWVQDLTELSLKGETLLGNYIHNSEMFIHRGTVCKFISDFFNSMLAIIAGSYKWAFNYSVEIMVLFEIT